MTDHILEGFLGRQHDEGMRLANESDLLTLVPISGEPPRRYLAEFRCTGLVRAPSGAIVEAHRFVAGISFSDDYLRHADPFAVLTWLGPLECWHPNISHGAPFVCVGRITPGTPLVELLYRLFEVITYNRVTPRDDDALNRDACAWARRNLDRFPVDRRPLKRRAASGAAPHAEPAPDFDVVEVRP